MHDCNLNLQTKNVSWPILNIIQMIQRLGNYIKPSSVIRFHKG